jgi:hypothetical protein
LGFGSRMKDSSFPGITEGMSFRIWDVSYAVRRWGHISDLVFTGTGIISEYS